MCPGKEAPFFYLLDRCIHSAASLVAKNKDQRRAETLTVYSKLAIESALAAIVRTDENFVSRLTTKTLQF
jgi:hypothetical protein